MLRQKLQFAAELDLANTAGDLEQDAQDGKNDDVEHDPFDQDNRPIHRDSTFIEWTTEEGWPFVVPYVWDVGEDENVERLIDKAIRLLLLHPTFEQSLWKNSAELEKLYNDETFGDVIRQVRDDVLDIVQIGLKEQARRKKIKKKTNGPQQTVLKRLSVDQAEEDATLDEEDDPRHAAHVKDLKAQDVRFHKQFTNAELNSLVLTFADWTELNEKFGIKADTGNPGVAVEKQLYLWSFLVSIACTIKYLEIEIISTPIFDDIDPKELGRQEPNFLNSPLAGIAQQQAQKKRLSKLSMASARSAQSMDFVTSFVEMENVGGAGAGAGAGAASTKGTRSVTPKGLDTSGAVGRSATAPGASPLMRAGSGNNTAGALSKRATGLGRCGVCGAKANDIRWNINDQPACERCIKFRVYQELVRKFVLECENADVRDDLLPWYENHKFNQDENSSVLEYRDILCDHPDSLLPIHTRMIDSSEDTAGSGSSSISNINNNGNNSSGGSSSGSSSSQKSKTYRSYRNVRYLRKFAAMFMLSQNDIQKLLLHVQKKVEWYSEAYQLQELARQEAQARRRKQEQERQERRDHARTYAEVLQATMVVDDVFDGSNDKSAVLDANQTIEITDEDRKHIKSKLFLNEKIAHALCKSYPNSSQAVPTAPIAENANEANANKSDGNGSNSTNSGANGSNGSSGSNGRYERNMASMPQSPGMAFDGIDRFVKTWTDVPGYWTVNHDMILLELALKHKLNIDKYKDDLKNNRFYEQWVETIPEGRSFVMWCEEKLAVMHRLRYLIHVIVYRQEPQSRVFLSRAMKKSHLNYVDNGFNPDAEDEEDGDNPDAKDQNDENADDAQNAAAAERAKPVRDIIGEFRDIVQLLEPETFGPRIWKYVLTQLQHKQRESLWLALTLMVEEFPSKMMVTLLEDDRDAIRRGKLLNVDKLCRAILKGSSYPMAMALHIAQYFEENATRDLARYDRWMLLSETYEMIAVKLLGQIENDFLLALLVEVPTDIGRKSVLEIAVQYHRTRFCNDSRVAALLSHMWMESEFLNPRHPIRQTDLQVIKVFKLLWRSPVGFYFSPMGLYFTACITYFMYVLLMTWITYQKRYPFLEVREDEYLLWVCNAGYIAYEINEMLHKKLRYFAEDGIMNVFDVIISLNWIMIFFIRFFPEMFRPYEFCEPCVTIAPTAMPTNYPVESQGPTMEPTPFPTYAPIEDQVKTCYKYARGSPTGCSTESHNLDLIIGYMILWSAQVVILWIRVIGLFQRTKAMGPFLRMLYLIVRDLLSFLFLAILVFTGFSFALYFIIAGDLERDLENDPRIEIPEEDRITSYLNSLRGCILYLIQTFLAQQDWDVLQENETYNLSRDRARVAESLILIFIILGTLLLLNLLIAVMANTFNQQLTDAKKELAFSRLETTYDLVHRGRLIPPPLNVLALMLWGLFEAGYYAVAIVTCNKREWSLAVDKINPYFMTWLNRGEDKMITYARHEELSLRSRGKSAQNGDDGKKPDSPGTLVDVFGGFLQLLNEIEQAGGETMKQYCRYCYHKMSTHKGGKIESYFERLKKFDFDLDLEDSFRVKRLFRYSELCPMCFRPFGLFAPKGSRDEPQVDRYTRHKVFSEIASCYVFVVFVWAPLLLFLSIPALLSYSMKRAAKLDDTAHVQEQEKHRDFNNDSFGDYHKGFWHDSMVQAIDSVKTKTNKNQVMLNEGNMST